MARRNSSRRMRRSPRKGSVPRGLGGSNALVLSRQWQADVAKITADSGLYRTFQASQFVPSDLFQVFQRYRFLSVKVEYQLYNQLNNNASFPTLYIAPQQWGELAVPTLITEVAQFNQVKTFQFGPSRPTYTQTFKPYVNVVTVGPGRNPVPSPWLATTGDAVQHMTHVDWLQNYNSTSAPTHTIRLVATAVIEFQGTR